MDFLSKLAKVYLFDKTKTWSGLVSRSHFQSHRRNFPKICVDPMDGFHIIWDKYIVRTSQRYY